MQQTSNTQKLGFKVAGSLLAFAVLLSSTFGVAAVQLETMNAAVCTDCQNPEPELPRLNGGLRGLPNLLATMVPAAVSLDENGKDPREPVKAEDNILGLGQIKVYASGRSKSNPSEIKKGLATVASATLINRCLIITNKHVVSSSKYNFTDFVFEAGIQFSPTSASANNAAQGTIVDSGNYDENDNSTFHEDWAVLKLDKNLGDEHGFTEPLFLEEDLALQLKDLTVAGLIEDDLKAELAAKRQISLKKHVGCEAKGASTDFKIKDDFTSGLIATGGMRTNCSSTPGTSGAGMFLGQPNSARKVVGIMRNSYSANKVSTSNLSSLNVYVPFIKNPSSKLSLSEARLAQIIQDNPCN